MSSRISTLKRGFICLMKLVSSSSASVSVAVETKTMDAVSADHPRDAVVMSGEPRIARNAPANAARLADIEHFAVGADHAIDTGADGSIAQMRADDAEPRAAARRRCGRSVETEIEAGSIIRRVLEFVPEIVFGRLGRQIAGWIGTARIVRGGRLIIATSRRVAAPCEGRR